MNSFRKTICLVLTAGCMLALSGRVAPIFAQETGPEDRSFDDQGFEDHAFYVSFQVPGYQDTYAVGINDFFTVAGECARGPFESHGYVRDVWGKITIFDPPNSLYTEVRGINNAGAIVGYFQPASGVFGFIRSRRGDITTFDYHGKETLPWSMNDWGVVTGFYMDASGDEHGFVRSPEGKITPFDVPGSTNTFPTSVNNEGVITGSYMAKGSQHGFVRDARGEFLSFDPPESAVTSPTGIDAEGEITGYYSDSAAILSPTHGFVRSRQGKITTFDPPQSTQTAPQSINGKGTVAGSYLTPEVAGGFVRTRQGKIVLFEYPGGIGTTALVWGINDFGAVLGTYQNFDVGTGTFTFVRVPERW